MTASSCCLDKDVQFLQQLTGVATTIGKATAGGDGGDGGVVREELLDLGQAAERVLEVVEAELYKIAFAKRKCSLFNEFGRRLANKGDTDLADAGAEELSVSCRHGELAAEFGAILRPSLSGRKLLLCQDFCRVSEGAERIDGVYVTVLDAGRAFPARRMKRKVWGGGDGRAGFAAKSAGMGGDRVA